MPGDGSTRLQVGDVDDQARALEQLMGRPATFGRRYNLTGAESVTRNEYVALCAAAIGVDADVHHIPADVMEDLWTGERSIDIVQQSGALDIRSSGNAKKQDAQGPRAMLRTRFMLCINLVQHLAPNVHWWNQDTSFSIDRLQTDVGWTPQHTTASMLDRAHTWWRDSDRADTAYDWTTEDQILACSAHNRPTSRDTGTAARCENMPSMFRRVIAGLILGPALLIGSFAWSGYLALGTIFDENRSATVAQELLDNEKVKAQVAANIAGAISSALPDGTPVTEEQIDAAALAVLNDGRATGLVINSLGETHRSFLGLNDVPQTVDLNPVAEVAREQIASISPEAAAAIPADTDWSIDLPTENIPNSSPVKTFLETSVPFLAGISLVMVLMAFLTTSDRPSVLRKAAFWATGTTAVYHRRLRRTRFATPCDR